MNAGAFNLGAGLSFAILFAVFTAFSGTDSASGYRAGIIAGMSILSLAFLTSFLIPRPGMLDGHLPEKSANH